MKKVLKILLSASLLICQIQSAKAELIFPERRIEINIPGRTLALKSGDTILREYPIGVGRSKKLMTPLGSYSIEEKLKNPGWTHPYTGQKIGPGPNNPLGTRWIGFFHKNDGIAYGLHGTNEASSIGKFVSHGCIRMSNKDVEELFTYIEVGTPVRIVYERVELKKYSTYNYVLVHPDPYGLQPLTNEEIAAKIEALVPGSQLQANDVKKYLSETEKKQLRKSKLPVGHGII